MRLARIVVIVVATVVVVAAGRGGSAKKLLPDFGDLFLVEPLIVFGVKPAGGCLVCDERAPKRRTQFASVQSQSRSPDDQSEVWQGRAALRCRQG